MSDMNQPGDLPPDLPPEYADAYRRGYQRAYEQASGTPPDEPEPGRPAREPAGRPTYAGVGARGRAGKGAPPAPAETEPTTRFGLDELFGNARRDQDAADEAAALEPAERPRWLVPAVLAALALVLIVGAYVVGRVFSSSVAASTPAKGQTKLVIPSPGTGQQSSATTVPPGQRYTGATDLATVTSASATCESPAAFDAGGNKVSYQPSNVFDQDISTAWRCNGDGHGEQLTLTLAHTMPIGEVGMVPGYAKTDPYDGADRYAENDRITKVRWTFDNGRSVVQDLNGSVQARSMQTIRIPVTKARTITMTVLDTVPGPRHTIAVSEVRIGRVAD